VVLLLLPATAWCAALELDALLKSMARPAPASTHFVEAHFSSLLSRPLIVSGELEYLGPDALARTVQAPYYEHTEVRGENVTVERDKGNPRYFSLKRAPELRTLLGSFAALLSGDRAALEQQFDLKLDGDTNAWTLQLTPRDAHVRQRVRTMTVNGSGSDPRCITTAEPNDNTTVTLLAETAKTPLPQAPDRAWLDAQCRGAPH
jgi:hypothetical protein